MEHGAPLPLPFPRNFFVTICPGTGAVHQRKCAKSSSRLGIVRLKARCCSLERPTLSRWADWMRVGRIRRVARLNGALYSFVFGRVLIRTAFGYDFSTSSATATAHACAAIDFSIAILFMVKKKFCSDQVCSPSFNQHCV